MTAKPSFHNSDSSTNKSVSLRRQNPHVVTLDAENVHRLLVLLSTEIAKDGGATVVVSLKDWYGLKGKIEQLLGRRMKLLQFFERHVDIFRIDRQQLPHVVHLVSNEYVDVEEASDTNTTEDTGNNERKKALMDQVCYVLRRRNARLERRRQQNHEQQNPDRNEVNVSWLLSQCSTLFHLYLRNLRGGSFYKSIYSSHEQVQIPGSKEWEELVFEEFYSFLIMVEAEEASSCIRVFPVAVEDNHQDKTPTIYQKPKVMLMENIDKPVSGNGAINDDQPSSLCASQVATALYAAIQQDGATTIAVSLLLHRYTALKKALGGRNLLTLVERHPDEFPNVEVYAYLGETFVKNSLIMENDDINTDNPHFHSKRRMDVDETGLFSVASGKWGTAIMTCIKEAVLQVQQRQRPSEDATTTIPNSNVTLAVDLTASVGGMTLAMARRFPPVVLVEDVDETSLPVDAEEGPRTTIRKRTKIVAIEIDPHRAELCKQNMAKFGYTQEDIEVWNLDAVEAIPRLPFCDVHTKDIAVVVIDPPWGGVHYRLEKNPTFQMGPWLLEDVVEKLARQFQREQKEQATLLVGLRMPVFFEVDQFASILQKRGLLLQKELVRKLGFQLVVVFSLTTGEGQSV